jgi:plastocyanin
MGRGVLAAASALLAVVFAATGLFAGQQLATAASGPVSISGLAFSPATINVNVGDTVTWTNNESSNIQHTVTSDSGTELASALLSPGNSYAHTFTIAGTYAYHCTIHPTMHGTVVVAAATTTAVPTTAAPTTAAPTTAVPTTAVPTTAVPTTAVPTTAVPTTAVPTTAAPTQPANAPINLTLTGANEVPPVTTNATGKFLATAGTNSLSFTLTASGSATGFTMAHIHQGAPGTNGPIVAFLFGPVTAGVGSINVSGTITQADLVGPLAGNMAGFMAALQAGNLYVNAHTIANPGGEIRAWIPAAPKPPAAGNGSDTSTGSVAPLLFGLAGMAGLIATAAGAAAVRARQR